MTSMCLQIAYFFDAYSVLRIIRPLSLNAFAKSKPGLVLWLTGNKELERENAPNVLLLT